MNSISVDISKHNGLITFELLVDGVPMRKFLGDGNEGIPFWIVKYGLPTYPPNDTNTESPIRIVSVCGCGEYGCGHSRCTITRMKTTVVFSNFDGDVGEKGKALRFIFPLSQYEEVCEKISKLANKSLSANS